MCSSQMRVIIFLAQLMLQYFETRVVTPVCDAELTAVENDLKSTSQFFKAACKAGPWVPDHKLHTKLSMLHTVCLFLNW